MTTVTLIDTPVVTADLRLVGLRLAERMEGCRCDPCERLDMHHDVDLLAGDANGLPRLVSYRRQDDYDYRTITVRWSSDRGSANVQGAKLTEGRSLAHLYVQAYPSGVAWAMAMDLRATIRRGAPCEKHERLIRGADGQTFAVFCSWCTAMHYVSRTPAPTPARLPDGTLPASAFDRRRF